MSSDRGGAGAQDGMTLEREAHIMVVSGPSGSGKSTLIHDLLFRHPEINFSVSHTTRERRPGEENGREYHFVARREFTRMVETDRFVEWAEVHGNLYGTSLQEIEAKSGEGRDLVLDVDVQGAATLKKRFPGALYVFIVAPTLAELRRRLVQRRGDSPPAIERRFRQAREEMKRFQLYDMIVVNDRLEEAAAVLESIYVAFTRRVRRMAPLIRSILEVNP